MTSLASRLYEGLGPRYIIVPGVAVVMTGLVATVIAAVGAVAYLEVPSRVFIGIFALGGVGSVVATILSVIAAAKIMGPFARWIAGRRVPEHALEAWHAGTRRILPIVLAGVGFFSIAVLPAEIYAIRNADVPLYGALFMVLAVEIIIGGAAIVDFFSVEGLFRPVLRDIAHHLPPNFELPKTSMRLRWKLLVQSSITTLVTGVLVAGVGRFANSSESRLAVGIAIAFGMAGSVSLILTLLATRAVASPVERLESASRAVESGDLSVRVPVTTTDEVGVLGHRFNAMVRGLKEREALRAAMGMYVDPDVAKRILEEGQLLEGTEVEVTVMFLDIRDFTALVEQTNARHAIAFLNRFFQLVVPIIDANGGHVNKFTGDGLLAVFGVPEAIPDHADRAVTAAQEIASRVAADYPTLGIGIGLNSGPVAAGTVGGGMHLEYTLIGDTVNVAARVEELTKGTPDQILMTEATRNLCSCDGPEHRGSIRLRGVAREMGVFAVSPQPDPDATVEPRQQRR